MPLSPQLKRMAVLIGTGVVVFGRAVQRHPEPKLQDCGQHPIECAEPPEKPKEPWRRGRPLRR